MNCVIFGGADISHAEKICIPLETLVIAADRGYQNCKKAGVFPHVLVGDMDSIEGDIPTDIRVVRAPCEKDDTDLIMAVREGMAAGCTNFHIYGAYGGRAGHTAANIQTLSFIASKGCEGVIHGENAEITVQREGLKSYPDRGYRYISLFSLSDSTDLRVSGLKYGDEFTLSRDYPMGVSNEFTEGSCKIEVLLGELLVILEK